MQTKTERLLYIDNIRWLMIVFVVLMHLNVTYSNMGLWYYKEPGNIGALSGLIFGIFGSFNQAYMMGLLFFIAGYFIPGSYDRKGAGKFIRDRLIRLGIPTLIYMLILHPATIMIYNSFKHNITENVLSWYVNYLATFSFLSTSGPLWFTLALLVFSLVYVLIRQMHSDLKGSNNPAKAISVTHRQVFSVIGFTALFAFLTRILIPAGVPLFNTLTGNFMQLGYFPSYIILFIVGITAYRQNIPDKLSYKFGRFWFRLALIIGFPLWLVVVIAGGITANPEALFGGFHWQSAAYSIWESFFCIGISLGLLAIFREKFNIQGRLSSFLSENAFCVYVFHAPILVAVTMALQSVVINPLAKMYLAALIVLPACFMFSCLIRKIPVIKRLFS